MTRFSLATKAVATRGNVRTILSTIALAIALQASLLVAAVAGSTETSATAPATTANSKIPELDEILRELDEGIDSPPNPNFVANSPTARGEVSSKRIKWRRCADAPQLQCGFLRVPKNWNKPRKGAKNTVTLALRRLPTTARASKRPTLFMNPGGPGASGTQVLTGIAQSLQPLRSRYNVVAWDPRGVPSSTPLPRNCPTMPTSASPATGSYTWAKVFGTRYRQTAKQLQACIQANKSLAKWVGTNQVVRDLDAMRRAVGDKKLSYLGFSYGTTIGRTYQLKFPRRVRVMLLDGATDPSVNQNQDAPARMAGSTRAWKMLWRGLQPGVRSAYNEVTKYLQTKTIKTDDGVTVTRWLWWTAMINSGRTRSSVAALPVLICTYAKQINASNSTCANYVPSSVQSRSTASKILLRLARIPLSSPILQLVNCSDSRGNITNKTGSKWVQRTARAGGPAAAMNNLNFLAICAGKKTGWNSIPGLTKRTKLPKPPLIVNGIGDIATPYDGANRTHRLLTGSRLVKVNTTVHGISLITGSKCVDRVVLKYLNTAKLPKRNTSCGPLPS